MQSSIDSIAQRATKNGTYLFPIVAGGLLLLFLAAPWPFALKAHASLHGLCAQTPSHTFLMGESRLPFDARMTGIYGGFIVSFLWLIGTGRGRSARLPSWPVLAVLAVLVGALAIDGFNSLFRDMGRSYPYEPDNRLRLFTGLGTGIALATMISYLIGVTMWRRPAIDIPVLTGRQLALLIPLQFPFALLVMSGWAWLYVPLSMLMLVAAVTAVASIAAVMLVLFKRVEGTFAEARQFEGYAAGAIVIAVLAMASISGARFLLERVLGIPPLT